METSLLIFSGTIDRSHDHSILGQELLVSVVGVHLDVIKYMVVPDPFHGLITTPMISYPL